MIKYKIQQINRKLYVFNVDIFNLIHLKIVKHIKTENIL